MGYTTAVARSRACLKTGCRPAPAHLAVAQLVSGLLPFLPPRWMTPSGSASQAWTSAPRPPPPALRCPSAGSCRRCTAPCATSPPRTSGEGGAPGGKNCCRGTRRTASLREGARCLAWSAHRSQRAPQIFGRPCCPRFDFGEAGRLLYDFVWSDFADWYIEAAKARLYGGDETAAAQVGCNGVCK